MARVRTHPGSVLRAELQAREMSASGLALAIRVPANRVTAILRGERAVSADTALRLGRYFGTGPRAMDESAEQVRRRRERARPRDRRRSADCCFAALKVASIL